MTDWDRTVYQLAEALHMSVTDIKERMPIGELMGWLRYFQEEREAKEQADNPLASGDAMLRAFKLG